jgi:uncharacterized protein YdhG (YjbR/CyaY superfamily)
MALSEQDLQMVDAYLDRLAPDRRAALAELRGLVRDAVPGVVETFKYNMPTYEHEGQVLCSFASQKHYMSLYMDVDVVAQHGDDLSHLDVGKSCIRFRKLESLPLDAVRRMLLETVERNAGT